MATKHIKEHGTSTIEEFFAWINERQKITLLKESGQHKPWTQDKIMQQYKFTNVFRELDAGTRALHLLIRDPEIVCRDDFPKIFWTICWYRLFNLADHARHFAKIGETPDTPVELENYMESCFADGAKIFTSCHMTTGVSNEPKHRTYLKAARHAYEHREWFVDRILQYQSIEILFHDLLALYMVGPFVAYELCCDLMYTKMMSRCWDKNTWANVGPGAERGLKRLGLWDSKATGTAMMKWLFWQAPKYLATTVPVQCESLGWYPIAWTHTDHPEYVFQKNRIDTDPMKCVNFTLREIEHSLCEFDKYCRASTGNGRPKEKYDGLGEES